MGRLKQQNEADFGIFALQMLKVHMSAANLAILRPKKILFPEMRVPRKIFIWAAANFF